MIPSSCEVTRVRLQQHASASSVDQEQARMLTCKPSRARSVIFDLLRHRQKRRRSKAPADGTFAAIVARTENSAFPFKGQLATNLH